LASGGAGDNIARPGRGLDLCANKSGHVTMQQRRTRSQPIADLIELYLLRCRVEGKAECTVRAYRWSLGRFLHGLADHGVPLAASSVTQEDVYRYLGSFAHLSLDTRHRYFREVRCFFNWIVEAGHLEASPFAHVRNVRLPSKIVQPFAQDGVRQLLAACSDEPAGVRDRAIMVTLLDTGLRVSELVQLNLDDVNLELMRLRVLHAKGNKQRVASFSGACKRDLVRYLDLRGDEPGPLFCATDGHGTLRPNAYLHSNGIKQMLRRVGRRTGLPKVHAHRFRHTFATWAIDQGARELDVQLLLGHSSPDMVRRYTSSYNAEQAARRHVDFSPATMLEAAAG
jgi:integrase/recombinase XerC/integrase/recombinase XerD